MSKTSLRRALPLVTVLAVFLSTITAAAAGPAGTVDVQILTFNDFHGNLEPSGSVRVPGGSVPAGGVEYMATHIKNLEATNPNTIIISAGDAIGASPLISALFHDEPTIEALNLMGVDYATVGNHEFDEGVAELKRMQEGGCHPVDGCQDGDPFDGADFRFLAANVVQEKNGKTLFPAYKVRSFARAKVAFIGVVLEGTPSIVTPSGVAGLQFLDEADTINAVVGKLKAKGIKAIVVIIHEGGSQSGFYNECSGIAGNIVDIVNRTDDEVDLFITGHTHGGYNCVIDGRVVTGAYYSGRILTDIDMTVDRLSGEVTSIQANNLIVTQDVAKDPALTALVDKYKALSAPLANRVIGSITADIPRASNAAGESALGDVIADAQLAATAMPGYGDAVVAFMNPGGIRADLLYNQVSGGEAPGEVTYGEAFTVQPFGNSLVTMSLSGAQIDTLLETQWVVNRILQVSNGFSYSWSLGAPVGNKVDIASIMINGVPIDPNGSYRVTVNSFLADGGDGFSVLTQGTDRLGGAVDLDALAEYFGANSPVAPGPQNRISVLP